MIVRIDSVQGGRDLLVIASCMAEKLYVTTKEAKKRRASDVVMPYERR